MSAMTSPAVDLQKAIHAALAGDPALTAKLGGGKIYDVTPASPQFPYVSFGRTSLYDWSTGTEIGFEQLFTVHVWSKARGKSEALEIMELARRRLADAALPLETHHLVSLRLEFSEVRYDDDLAVHHGLLRFRALIEAGE
jgi:hypothetical protein